MPSHQFLTLTDNHPIGSLEYANQTAREAATSWSYTNSQGNTVVVAFTADDLGRVAHQTDNNTWWILNGVSPTTWLEMGAGGTVANAVTSAAVIAADALVIGDDGMRGVKAASGVASPSQGGIVLQNTGGAEFGAILISGSATDFLGINASDAGSFVEFENFDELRFTNSAAVPILVQSNVSYNDTTPFIDWHNLGTNGGQCDWYLSTRTPDSNITASPGDICIRDNVDLSRIYIHLGSASDNTSWAFCITTADVDLNHLTRTAFTTSTNTAALGGGGQRGIYACTDTTAARTLTLSTSSITGATANSPWLFAVKDESGGAATNNITIDTEGSETIDGASSIVITADYGIATLYSNGTNVFSR